METMRVATVQIRCKLGDVTYNIQKMAEWTRRAKDQGAEVVLFPEMVTTGYDMSVITRHAAPLDGDQMQPIRSIAREFHIWLFAGIAERSSGKIYNTLVVIDPAGELIATYRKIHLANYHPVNEGEYIVPGSQPVLVTISGWHFGLQICYDVRFPELSRYYALKGADVLVFPAAWPFPRLRHWVSLLHARAIENQLYVVGANHVGREGEILYCGASRIVDPYGLTLGEGAEDREMLTVAEISRERLLQVRQRMPVLKHRRNDVY